jgi:class 3 adenylate cyclase
MTAALDLLGSYVPALVARRLAAASIDGGPAVEVFEAATFFADISGFTPLARRLAERGPAGAEDLTRILNDYFGELIALITAHGGEAVKSAGDALLALWPVEKARGETLADATRRAATCALAVLSALAGREVEGGSRLTLHIGIGAGEVRVLYVGGAAEQWYFLVAGDPVRQMGVAEQQARPGEAALSPDAWALVADSCSAAPRDAGRVHLTAVHHRLPPRPATPAPVPEHARGDLDRFIPVPVRTRLAAGYGDWIAELRRVSVLFINLIDLPGDADSTLRHAHAVMSAVRPVFDWDGIGTSRRTSKHLRGT